jgi:hypothetical protein
LTRQRRRLAAGRRKRVRLWAIELDAGGMGGQQECSYYQHVGKDFLHLKPLLGESSFNLLASTELPYQSQSIDFIENFRIRKSFFPKWE